MKLVRPYVSLHVRLQVIAWQLQECGQTIDVLAAAGLPTSAQRLAFMLKRRFGDEKVHLDHDPPLMLRYLDDETGEYDPPANDPRYLIYRTEEDHRVKTFIRGDGAQLSDAAKRRKKIKSERQDRPWPKWPPGRKLRSRPFRRAR